MTNHPRLKRPKRTAIEPTDKENAIIQAGIDADPDAIVMTDEDWRHMQPASEVLPGLIEKSKRDR